MEMTQLTDDEIDAMVQEAPFLGRPGEVFTKVWNGSAADFDDVTIINVGCQPDGTKWWKHAAGRTYWEKVWREKWRVEPPPPAKPNEIRF